MPVAMLSLLDIDLNIISSSRKRFSKKIFHNIEIKLLRIGQNATKINEFYIELRFLQKMICHNIKEFKKINQKAISTLFARCMIVTLAGNVIFAVEILIGKININVKVVIFFIILFHIFVIMTIVFHLVVSCKNIYNCSHLYLYSYIYLSKHYKIQTLFNFFRLANFLEVIHTRKKFAFSSAALGKITIRSVIAFIPLYTSFIMKVIPLIPK